MLINKTKHVMKKLAMLIVITTLIIGCKKKDKEEEPTPDFTAGVVGTYVGDYQYLNSSGGLISEDLSHTITVAKFAENEIKVMGCNGGGFGPVFLFNLTGSDYGAYLNATNGSINYNGSGSNQYVSSNKQIVFYIKEAAGTYQYFSGIKQ